MKYHLGKANMVPNTLSRVSMSNVSHLESDGKKELGKEGHMLARLRVILNDADNSSVMVLNNSKSSLIEEVKSNQDLDPTLIELKAFVKEGKVEVFSQGGDGVLRYRDRLCAKC